MARRRPMWPFGRAGKNWETDMKSFSNMRSVTAIALAAISAAMMAAMPAQAAGKTERDAAVEKVVAFHAAATESLNVLRGAIDALKDATAKIGGREAELKRANDSAAEISSGLSTLARDIMTAAADGKDGTSFDEARIRGIEAMKSLESALAEFDKDLDRAKKQGDKAVSQAAESIRDFDNAIDKASRARFSGGKLVREADDKNNELAYANAGSRERLSKEYSEVKDAYGRALAAFLEGQKELQKKIADTEKNIGTVDAALVALRRPQAGLGGGETTVITNVITNAPEKTYSVQFFSEEVEFHRQTGRKGEKVAKPLSMPVKPHCDFKFWSAAKDGPKYEGFGTDALGESAPEALYAIFDQERPGIALFWLDKAKTRLFEKREYMRSERKTLEKPLKGNPEAWGYRFADWCEAGEEAPFDGFGTEMVDDEKNLFAKWEEVPVKAEFYTIGADGAAHKVRELEVRLSDRILETCPDEPGYEFRGWGVPGRGVDASGVSRGALEPVTGETYLDNLPRIDDGTGVAKFFAIRDVLQYTATFASWDGNTLAVATGSVEKAVSAPTAPEVAGYVFRGWIGETGDIFKAGPISSDIVVAASYEPVIYTARIHLADGTVEDVKYSIEEPLDIANIPLQKTSTRISHSLSLNPEGKPILPVTKDMTGDVDIYVVRSAHFRFRNNSQTIAEQDVAVGGVLVPPRLKDKATGLEIEPLGWAPWSNFTPIDLSAPMTEERLENRDIEQNLFYDGAMQLFPIWADPAHRPEVEAME